MRSANGLGGAGGYRQSKSDPHIPSGAGGFNGDNGIGSSFILLLLGSDGFLDVSAASTVE